jgi:transcription initiation factor TFIID TATA-box-binding protein
MERYIAVAVIRRSRHFVRMNPSLGDVVGTKNAPSLDDIIVTIHKVYEDVSDVNEDSLLMNLENIIQDGDLPKCYMVNVVCTYNLGVRLNLRKIALYKKDKLQCKFNPVKFAAMTLTVKTKWLAPTTALVFSSSNIVHTGAKTEEHARQSAWALTYYFNKFLEIPVSLTKFKITNIVSHFNVGYKVDLKTLAAEIGARATFEPNMIQSCRVRDKDDPKLVCLVYHSGAVVVTGAKKRKHVKNQYRLIGDICKRHRSN